MQVADYLCTRVPMDARMDSSLATAAGSWPSTSYVQISICQKGKDEEEGTAKVTCQGMNSVAFVMDHYPDHDWKKVTCVRLGTTSTAWKFLTMSLMMRIVNVSS